MTDIIQDVINRKRENERLFCAGVFINPFTARKDIGWLTPDMIHDERCRVFWREILAGKAPVDAALSAEVYQDILAWQQDIVSSLEYESFARQIADDAYYLGVATAAPELWRGIHERDSDLIRSTIENMTNMKPISGDDIPDSVDVALDFNVSLDDPNQSVLTHIRPLDDAIGGFERKTMTILAARPSMGKSALAFQIARNWAASGTRVLFFSLEMSAKVLWARAACGAVGVSWRDVRSHNVSAEKIELIKQKSMELAEKYEDRLRIDDSSKNTVDAIWKKVAKYQPDAIIIDHIGLVSGQGANETIIKYLGRVSWAGKQLAKEFNLVTLMLHQLNRNVEGKGRTDRRPNMSDLRDSGEVEQNADNVLFIHRDDYYQVDIVSKISPTEIIVSKFRDGARNQQVRLQYNLSEQWFYAKDELP
jgi:KaiC/GvpD/RAD55 family RecA-like ATPase